MKRGSGAPRVAVMDGETYFRLDHETPEWHGLDLEYAPPMDLEVVPPSHESVFGPHPEAAKQIRYRLQELEYVRPWFPDQSEEIDDGAYYAWYASNGDWIMRLTNTQENSFWPMAVPTWLKDVSAAAIRNMPSFREREHGTPAPELAQPGTFAGLNSVLISWCPDSVIVPRPRLGVNAAKWRDQFNQVTVFAYFGPTEQTMVFTPGNDASSRRYHDPEKSHALHIKMKEGSVVIIRGGPAHMHWDVSYSPASTTDGPADHFYLCFQQLSMWHMKDEHRERPPTRTQRGLFKEKRAIPVLYGPTHVVRQVILPDAPPPPPVAIDDEDGKEEASSTKKRARPVKRKK